MKYALRILTLLLSGLAIGWELPAARELHPYSCVTRQYDTDRWVTAGHHAFDADGVLTMAGQYHPLSICFYGILRYEDYMRTCDSTHRQAAIAQYQYFTKGNHTIYKFRGRGLGLPYRYRFKDMKPPWFSGMTQGVAVSYLLRYFDLTGDASALRVAQQCIYFMLQPESAGGTIGTTPEGLPWIEEYPNSTDLIEVMNGAINALIGLKEYTDWFPQDTFAGRMHRALYASFRQCLSAYDHPDWTQYNRRSALIIRRPYMRYQVTQLEHLYALYGDPEILKQWIIWAKFAMDYGDAETTSYLRPGYRYMSLFFQSLDGDGWRQRIAFDSCLIPISLWHLERPPVAMSRGGHPKSESLGRYDPLPMPQIHKSGEFVRMNLRVPQHYVQLRFENFDPLNPPLIEAWNSSFDRLEADVQWAGTTVEICAAQPISEISIGSVGPEGSCWTLRSAWRLDPQQYEHPRFLYLPLGKQYLEQGKDYLVIQESERIAGMQVFYRYSPRSEAVGDSLWRRNHVVELPIAQVRVPETGYYEAFVAVPVWMPNPVLHALRLQEM